MIDKTPDRVHNKVFDVTDDIIENERERVGYIKSSTYNAGQDYITKIAVLGNNGIVYQAEIGYNHGEILRNLPQGVTGHCGFSSRFNRFLLRPEAAVIAVKAYQLAMEMRLSDMQCLDSIGLDSHYLWRKYEK